MISYFEFCFVTSLPWTHGLRTDCVVFTSHPMQLFGKCGELLAPHVVFFSLELRDVFALLEISGPITSLPLCVFEALPIENCKSTFLRVPARSFHRTFASGRQSLLSKKQRKELTPFFFGLQLRNNTPRRIGRQETNEVFQGMWARRRQDGISRRRP